ncbi:MAG: hypothetical protein E4G96_04950, partial [Chrysiogenales bacterium]
HKNRLPPYPQLLAMKNHLFPLAIGYNDSRGRTPLSCEEIGRDKLMVALVFGQSNSGNHGETGHVAAGAVYNFFRGRCYRAADPLLGPTGDRGSIWTRLGDLLIVSGLYKETVFIPIGVGSTTIEDWSRGGYLHSRLHNAIREVRSCGLAITHLFWVQGGSERKSSGDMENVRHYRRSFLDMLQGIRDEGIAAPIFVAVSTFDGTGVNPDIQAAQRELPDPRLGIFAGPDDDAILQDPRSRWEGLHLSAPGLDRCAAEWLRAIRRTAR